MEEKELKESILMLMLVEMGRKEIEAGETVPAEEVFKTFEKRLGLSPNDKKSNACRA